MHAKTLLFLSLAEDWHDQLDNEQNIHPGRMESSSFTSNIFIEEHGAAGKLSTHYTVSNEFRKRVQISREYDDAHYASVEHVNDNLTAVRAVPSQLCLVLVGLIHAVPSSFSLANNGSHRYPNSTLLPRELKDVGCHLFLRRESTRRSIQCCVWVTRQMEEGLNLIRGRVQVQRYGWVAVRPRPSANAITL